jgi:hypothetical protein
VYTAIFDFTGFPRLRLEGKVNPIEIRKTLATATKGHTNEVKFQSGRYLPRLVSAFYKHSFVDIERVDQKFRPSELITDYAYRIYNNEMDAPQIAIINNLNKTEIFNNGFFTFLLHGLEPRPERHRWKKGEGPKFLKQKRDAEIAAAQAAQLTPQGHKIYTPEQQRIRNQAEKDLRESYAKSEGAMRRHARKRGLKKYHLPKPFQEVPPDRSDPQPTGRRKVTVDFSGIDSKDKR